MSATPPNIAEEDIRRLLAAFYARARADDMLGPVFAAAVGTTDEDWAPHLARLQDFWSQVMLRHAGRYRGDPYGAHLRLLPGLRPEMFDRWLSLFGAACDETLAPEAATAFRERAALIARSLRTGLFAPPPLQRPARSALPMTASEEVAITTAAPSGVTSPATAAGTAKRL